MMKKFTFLLAALVILAFQVGPLTTAQADVVGHLTLVEGRVDILRGGQLPATPVKLDDGVQPGDVLRTKSLSKAEITFMDNSTMKISPESRVAIEKYMFDPAQKKRNAVIQLFQGLAYVVVHKVFQADEPDFVVKTHTAIMGIRGTEFGILLQPNLTTVLDFEGVIQVGNIFPEVGQLSRRAAKIAFAWGPGAQKWVFLHKMQGTAVGLLTAPTPFFTITLDQKHQFINQRMNNGLISRRHRGGSGQGSVAGGGTSGGGAGSSGGSASSSGSGSASGGGGAGAGDTGSLATFISTSSETLETGGTAMGSLGIGTLPAGAGPTGLASTSGSQNATASNLTSVPQSLTGSAASPSSTGSTQNNSPQPPPPLPPPPAKKTPSPLPPPPPK
jgi:hypothetical protein